MEKQDPPRLWAPIYRLWILVRQRHGMEALIVYLGFAWTLVAGLASVGLPLGLPVVTLRGIGEILFLLAFPIGVFGWVYDRRTAGAKPYPQTREDWIALTSTVVLLAVGTILYFVTRPPLPPIEGTSIAILPFVDPSGAAEKRYLRDAIQQVTLDYLRKIPEPKVVDCSRGPGAGEAQTKNLQETMKRLHVAYAVEGTVEQVGNKIRVLAHLWNTQKGTVSWSCAYDRDESEIFAVTQEIAQHVVEKIHEANSPPNLLSDRDAHEPNFNAALKYTAANAKWKNLDAIAQDQEWFQDIIGLLQEAIRLDPQYVEPLVLLTRVQASYFRVWSLPPVEEDKARAYAEKVAELRPGSVQAKLAKGFYLLYAQHDYSRARVLFTEVEQRTVNNADAAFCLATIVGREDHNWSEAATQYGRAWALEPGATLCSPGTFTSSAHCTAMTWGSS